MYISKSLYPIGIYIINVNNESFIWRRSGVFERDFTYSPVASIVGFEQVNVSWLSISGEKTYKQK